MTDSDSPPSTRELLLEGALQVSIQQLSLLQLELKDPSTDGVIAKLRAILEHRPNRS